MSPITPGEWAHCAREDLPVSECACGGYIFPDIQPITKRPDGSYLYGPRVPLTDDRGVVWFEATCRQCNRPVAFPNGKTLDDVAGRSEAEATEKERLKREVNVRRVKDFLPRQYRND